MNVSELLALFRREAEDSTFTYDHNLPDSFSLWSNFQLITYLNQVQEEFAIRTFCFMDSTNFIPEVTEADPWIDIDERILRVERAELVSKNLLLDLKSIEEFQTSIRPGTWETKTGTPKYLITDIETNKYRLFPIPVEDDTVKLTVRRLPFNVINELNDELEIPRRYHFGLISGLKLYAYANPKAVSLGYGSLLPYEQTKWEDVLLRATKDYNVKVRGPGKTRYGGL